MNGDLQQDHSHAGWQPHLVPGPHGMPSVFVHLAWHLFVLKLLCAYVYAIFVFSKSLKTWMSLICTNISVNVFSWIFVCIHPLKLIKWTALHSSLVLPLCVFQWSDKPCVPHLLQRDSYYVYTQQELKEKLYQEIISYFDKGKVSVVGGCFCMRAKGEMTATLTTLQFWSTPARVSAGPTG